jgi:hypothetical protein
MLGTGTTLTDLKRRNFPFTHLDDGFLEEEPACLYDFSLFLAGEWEESGEDDAKARFSSTIVCGFFFLSITRP